MRVPCSFIGGSSVPLGNTTNLVVVVVWFNRVLMMMATVAAVIVGTSLILAQ